MMVGLLAGLGLLILLAWETGSLDYYGNRANQQEGVDPLIYIPDSSVVVGLDVGSLKAEPAAADLAKKLADQMIKGSFLAELPATLGEEFTDLFNVVICAGRRGQPGAAGGPRVNPFPNPTIVAVSATPFDQYRLRSACGDVTPRRHEGRTYFHLKNGEFSYLYMPSAYMLILTSMAESDLTSVMNYEGYPPPLANRAIELARDVQSSHYHFWAVASVDRNVRSLLDKLAGMYVKTPPADPENRDFQDKAEKTTPQKQSARQANLFGRTRALGIWGNVVGDTLELAAGARCDDESSVKSVTEAASSIWQGLAKATDPPPGFAGLLPPLAPYRQLLQELKSSIRFAPDKSLARATARLKVSSLESLFDTSR
jgi:hypothetical protein